MTNQFETFELEPSAPLKDGLLMDDYYCNTRRRISWHHRSWPLLRPRTIIVALVGTMMIVSVFCIIATRSALEEELPAKASSFDLLELLFGADDEIINTTIPFLTNDFHNNDSSTRLQSIDHADLGFLPYGEEIDRTICENNTEFVEWQWYTYENLQYSETLRCYNLTYRWCFVNDLPPEALLAIDDSYYGDLSSCAFPFYDHNDVLYSSAGQRMPKGFNSRCSDRLEWGLWFTIIPLTGCGIEEYRYRFCDSQGNVTWDMVNGVGPFNCREFNAIDLYKEGGEDESGMEDLCEEQTNECADNAQLACKDGKYDPTVRWEAGRTDRCSTFVNYVDYNLIWAGQKTKEGLDLVCLPY